MRLFLEPADGWVFRGNRPFGEGGDNHAESAFPPSPSVVAGALRTAILRQRGVDLDELKRGGRCLPADLEAYLGYAPGPGRDFVPGRFHVRELEVAVRSDTGDVSTLREAPADVVTAVKAEQRADGDPRIGGPGRSRPPSQPATVGDESDGREAGFLRPVELARFGAVSSATHPWLPWNTELGRFQRSRGLLSPETWEDYLAGRGPLRMTHSLSAWFSRELRVGIGLNAAARTAEKGKLYTTEHVMACDRLEMGSDYQRPGLVVDVPGLENVLQLPTVVRLGGDGKLARVIAAAKTEESPPPGIDAGGTRFRLVLRSPLPVGEENSALQVEGGRPFRLAEGALEARIVALAGDPAEFLGGFDLILGAPKPSVRALPAGTVLWCEAVKGRMEEFVSRFHRRSLCAEGSPRWAEGFGLAVVATWI